MVETFFWVNALASFFWCSGSYASFDVVFVRVGQLANDANDVYS